MKNLAASVRARLAQRRAKTGEDFNVLLLRFTLERFLYRLSRSQHRKQFLLKEAILFALWEPTLHRVTRDLDLLGFGNPSPDRLGAIVACGLGEQKERVRLLARSPNLNAFPERFVRSIRQECLDRMVIFGEASSRRVAAEFVSHYNREQNHQSLENKIIQPELSEFPATGAIRRHERLGGLLNYYYREAA